MKEPQVRLVQKVSQVGHGEKFEIYLISGTSH